MSERGSSPLEPTTSQQTALTRFAACERQKLVRFVVAPHPHETCGFRGGPEGTGETV